MACAIVASSAEVNYLQFISLITSGAVIVVPSASVGLVLGVSILVVQSIGAGKSCSPQNASALATQEVHKYADLVVLCNKVLNDFFLFSWLF